METTVLDGRVGLYTIEAVKRTWLSKGHDGEILFTRCVKGMQPAFSYSEKRWVTGLTKDEATSLENEMGLKPGTLSPYNKDYWKTFRITIPKEGLILDVSKPQDYLTYKILKASHLVASSRADLESEKGLSAEWYLTSQEIEQAETSSKMLRKTDAFKKYAAMSISDMRDFLIVHGDVNGKFLRVTDKHTPEFLTTEVGKIVDGAHESFLDTLEDKFYKGKLLIRKAVINGVIEVNKNKYTMKGDTEPFAYNLTEALEFVFAPENQTILLNIKSRLQAAE